jgi:hypothetical protein
MRKLLCALSLSSLEIRHSIHSTPSFHLKHNYEHHRCEWGWSDSTVWCNRLASDELDDLHHARRSKSLEEGVRNGRLLDVNWNRTSVSLISSSSKLTCDIRFFSP